MKNIIKYGLLATLICSCSNNQNKKNVYTDLSLLLNDCKGYAIVVSKAHDKAYISGYEHLIIIRDANDKTYTYQGSKFDVKRGDTLIMKPSKK